MPASVNVEIAAQTSAAQAALSGFLGMATRGFTSLAGIAATVAGAMAALTTRAVNLADAMGKTAQKVGIAVEDLTALAYAAEFDEVQIGELEVALRGLSQWMVKNGEGGRDVAEVLTEQADLFARMPDGAAKTALAMERFGRAGQQMIPFLNQGSDGIARLREEAQRTGNVISNQTAEQADRFNDALLRLRKVADGFFLKMAETFLPTLTSFIERLSDFVKLGPELGVIGETLKGLATVILNLASAFTLGGDLMAAFATGVHLALIDPLHAVEGFTDEVAAAWNKYTQSVQDNERAFTKTVEEEAGKRRQASLAGLISAEHEKERLLRKNLDDLSLRASVVEGDLNSSRQQKHARLTEIYREQLAIIREIQEVMNQSNPNAQMFVDEKGIHVTEDWLQVNQEANKLLREREELQRRLADLNQDSFSGRLTRGLNDLQDQWSNVAGNIADSITGTLATAFGHFGDMLFDVIEGTRTWGQVGYQVLRQLAVSIVNAVVQWAASMLVIKAIKKLLHLDEKTEASQMAAAWAPAAVSASVASYGAASVTGTAAFLTALAIGTSVATGASLAAFEKGGRVRGGKQLIQVNEAGEEIVMNASASERWGAVLEAMNAGATSLAGLRPGISAPNFRDLRAASSPSIHVGAAPVTVAVINNDEAFRQFLESTAGRKVLLDIQSGQKLDLGIPA